jgi:subtilase family serine protease
VPDVAGPGDPASGFMVVYSPPSKPRNTYTIGGTSASSPFWAASMILVRQLAEKDGVGRNGRGRLGHLAPLLYDLAESAPAGTLFHDITIGSNLYHEATTGWDYATGLGSPRVGPLADAIVARLSATP